MNGINVRRAFDQELKVLETDLLRLGTLAEDAVSRGVWALKEQDTELAREVVAGDDRLDDLTVKIESGALQIIARYQPVALDLRTISAILFMAVDLERIGDHGVTVAKSALRLAEEGLVKPFIDIPAMATHLKKMVDISLGAFLDRDTQAAREVCRMDDYMDDLDYQIFRELLVLMMGDPRMIRPATELIAVSRTLERAGDHATNLAERIIYMVSGKVERASQHRRPKSKEPGTGDSE